MFPRFTRFLAPRRAHALPPQEGYDLWAEDYDDERNPVLDLEERAMTVLLPSLEGKRVLDAGCGTGRAARRAWELGAALVVGVDFARRMLSRARQHGHRLLAQADLGALPLPDACFDVVISAFVLEHVPDFARAVRELSRVTAPDGVVVLSDFHPFGAFMGWERAFRRQEAGRLRVYTIQRTPHLYEEYARVCRIAGLVVEEVVEPRIDESVRFYFDAEGSLDAYERYRGLPVVLAIRARKYPQDAG